MSNEVIIFLVGVGASVELYQPLLTALQHELPHAKIKTLNWWQESDFGAQSLKMMLENSNVTLLGHSAGGVVALQAFEILSKQISKIIMLDSHQIHHISKLPTISALLELTLAGSSTEIKKSVEEDYAPVVNNDKQFYKAFNHTIDWVNSNFELTCQRIQFAPAHTISHIGFTDSDYKVFGANAADIEQKLWGKYGIDTFSMPMHHFDLIDTAIAPKLARKIITILNT